MYKLLSQIRNLHHYSLVLTKISTCVRVDLSKFILYDYSSWKAQSTKAQKCNISQVRHFYLEIKMVIAQIFVIFQGQKLTKKLIDWPDCHLWREHCFITWSIIIILCHIKLKTCLLLPMYLQAWWRQQHCHSFLSSSLPFQILGLSLDAVCPCLFVCLRFLLCPVPERWIVWEMSRTDGDTKSTGGQLQNGILSIADRLLQLALMMGFEQWKPGRQKNRGRDLPDQDLPGPQRSVVCRASSAPLLSLVHPVLIWQLQAIIEMGLGVPPNTAMLLAPISRLMRVTTRKQYWLGEIGQCLSSLPYFLSLHLLYSHRD